MVSDSTSPVNDRAKVMMTRWAMLGRMWRRMMVPSRTPRARAAATKSASRSLNVSPRAMRQKCTQPVTPSATHTCTVPLPSAMIRAISSKRLGTDALAEEAGGYPEHQGNGNDDEAGQATDQQGDPRPLERAVDDVAPEDVGA